jgi:hypothetical protein
METVNKVIDLIIDPAVTLLFALAIVYFSFGVVKYIMNADSDEGRETGAKHVMYSVIGLFIMISVWGIIRFLEGVVGVR